MNSFQNRSHACAVLSAIVLCVLCIYWEWLGAPLRPGGSWLILKIVPLALCIPSMCRANLYTLQAVSMLILLYMAEGIIRGMGDSWPSMGYGWATFALSWTCFFGCILYVHPFKVKHKLDYPKQ